MLKYIKWLNSTNFWCQNWRRLTYLFSDWWRSLKNWEPWSAESGETGGQLGGSLEHFWRENSRWLTWFFQVTWRTISIGGKEVAKYGDSRYVIWILYMRIQGDWPIYFQVDGEVVNIGNNGVTKVAKHGDNLVGHLNTSDAKIQYDWPDYFQVTWRVFSIWGKEVANWGDSRYVIWILRYENLRWLTYIFSGWWSSLKYWEQYVWWRMWRNRGTNWWVTWNTSDAKIKDDWPDYFQVAWRLRALTTGGKKSLMKMGRDDHSHPTVLGCD